MIEPRFEVGVKFFVGNSPSDLSAVQERAAQLGYLRSSVERHSDQYFNLGHRDLVERHECLRLRTTPAITLFTWKSHTTDEMARSGHYWKKVVHIDATSSSEEMCFVLEALDGRGYCIVDKSRQVFVAPDEDGVLNLDEVGTLGYFAEIKRLREDPSEGAQINMRAGEELGLVDHPLISVPYTHMILAGRVYTTIG